MSYRSRLYNHRNAQSPEVNDKPFFSKQHDSNDANKKGTFFQPKLSINKPGDQYEQEADNVANTVVNNKTTTPVLQQKKISSIQRLATTPEEEKVSTNDGRMDRDKEKPFQRMPADPEKEKMKGIQKMDDPEKKKMKGIQKMDNPEKEKMKDIQKMDDPEKKKMKGIQKMDDPEKEKMKGVQKMDDPEKEKMKGIQKMDDPMKEEEKKKTTAVQTKQDSGANTASSQVSSKIENSSGKGNALPKNTLHEMSSSFGVDFSNVNIHNDSEAATMNRELQAQAFTHGSDIYFNEGKYNPGNVEGKFLLAHELTHVVQQQAHIAPKMLQRKVVVNPATKINEVISELNAFCPQVITAVGNELQADCATFDGSTQGCDCARQVICDSDRQYTITVNNCSATPKDAILWDQSVVPVPNANNFPKTILGDNPSIQICDPTESGIEFGVFDSDGNGFSVNAPRILAHELCGHGLHRTGGRVTGNRPDHDPTIDIENAIGAEMGQAARGHFSDRHQGESFFRNIGESEIVFQLQDGTHFENLIHNLTSPLFAGDSQLEDIFDGKISSNLRFGARNDAVGKIQEALITLGFPLPVFGADGNFKSETFNALTQYQRSRKLNPDGIVGAQTMRALENDMS